MSVLGHVVRLGHDVPRALVADALEALVAVHQDLARTCRERDREGQVVGLWVRARGGWLGGHGARHATSSWSGFGPNCVTTVVKVRVCVRAELRTRDEG